MSIGAIAAQPVSALARPLPILVPLIREEIEHGKNAGEEYYRRAGEMLLEAKEQVPHGEWQSWVKRNFSLGLTSAKYYMSLVRQRDSNNARPVTFSSLRQATRPNRGNPAWHAPVRETLAAVDVEKLAQDRQAKEKEERLVAGLKRQIVDIGYKALATKLHPDKGGSQEAMTRLNKAKAELKGAI